MSSPHARPEIPGSLPTYVRGCLRRSEKTGATMGEQPDQCRRKGVLLPYPGCKIAAELSAVILIAGFRVGLCVATVTTPRNFAPAN